MTKTQKEGMKKLRKYKRKWRKHTTPRGHKTAIIPHIKFCGGGLGSFVSE